MSKNFLTLSPEERLEAIKEYLALNDGERMGNEPETGLNVFEYIAEGHKLRYAGVCAEGV